MIKLKRIAEQDYRFFIQEAARKNGGKSLAEEVMSFILTVTECHASYVNRLCGYFWLLDQFPHVEQVRKHWNDIIESKRPEFTEIS